eukprot:maker-scaffold_26-snap-gene-4.4-mRNA-1 protein AED:0.00 eAED:0.00 QI:88/1/1/1/1/1/3/42/401
MKPLKLVVLCFPGLENCLLNELKEIGRVVTDGAEKNIVLGATIVPGGVEFQAHVEGFYKVILKSRVASKVLVRCGSFIATEQREFMSKLKNLNLQVLLPNANLRFKISLESSKFHHTDLVERMARKTLERQILPSLDFIQTVEITAKNNNFSFSLDATQFPLYNRGYRGYKPSKMPLKPTIAAAAFQIIHEGESSLRLYDPFCGSGTFVFESVLSFVKKYPGILKLENGNSQFNFFHWTNFVESKFNSVVEEIKEEERNIDAINSLFIGSDVDENLIQSCNQLAKELQVDKITSFSVGNVSNLNKFIKEKEVFSSKYQNLLLTNPVWGLRSSNVDQTLSKFGKELAHVKFDTNLGLIFPSNYKFKHKLSFTKQKFTQKFPNNILSGNVRLQLFQTIIRKKI